MSNHDGTGQYYDPTYPADSEPVYRGALEIRDLRKGVEFRTAMEHSQFEDSSAGGEHLQGSAKFYSQSVAPTTRPNSINDPWGTGATILTAADDGRGWVDEDVDWLYILTDGSVPTWTSIGTMLGPTWSVSGANPLLTQQNTDEENTDGTLAPTDSTGRGVLHTFKGEKSDSTVVTQAQVKICHKGTADDSYGAMIFSVNNGTNVTEVMRLVADESGDVQMLMNSKVLKGLGVPAVNGEPLIYEMADGSKAIEIDTSKLDVKDGGISAAQMATGAAWRSSGATVFATAAAPTTFTDLDLSGTIGLQKTLVMLKVSAAGTARFQFRTNGASEDIGRWDGYNDGMGTSYANIAASNIAYIMVETDASGIVEWESSTTSDATIVLVGYIK